MMKLKQTALILVFFALVGAVLTGCGDKCKCPAGTTHEPGKECCDGGPDCKCGEKPIPVDHEGEIDAFGRTVEVIGDASISPADFEKAKVKLKDGLDKLQELLGGNAENMFGIPVLDRQGFAIMINAGGGAPVANAQKQLTVGIDYLFLPATDATAIAIAITQARPGLVANATLAQKVFIADGARKAVRSA